MNLKTRTLIFALAVSAHAGPPLICHPIEIAGAKSLPWNLTAQGWNGAAERYNAPADLVTDTLALLTRDTPVPVRMETLRRASIYAARQSGLAAELAAKLEARAKQRDAIALNWFDAGYWIESVRQASFIYRDNMLSPGEKEAWHIRTGLEGRDGYPLVKKAIALGGPKEIARAFSLIEQYRKAGTN